MIYLYVLLICVALFLIGRFNYHHVLRSASRLLRDLADDL